MSIFPPNLSNLGDIVFLIRFVYEKQSVRNESDEPFHMPLVKARKNQKKITYGNSTTYF